MILQIYLCISLGFAMMLPNAGGGNVSLQHPSLSVSLREMTLVDRLMLKCESLPEQGLPCSFYICVLNSSTPNINISRSQQCVLEVSGEALLTAGAVQLDAVREEMQVYCAVTNRTEDRCSGKETIAVWRIALPMSYAVLGVVVFGFVIILSLACLCIACVISVSTNDQRKDFPTRSGRALEGNRDDHKLNSAPEEDDEKETKVILPEEAEEELCYATVIHPESSARSIKFEQSTEYATVVINTPDTNKKTVDKVDDTGKDDEDLI